MSIGFKCCSLMILTLLFDEKCLQNCMLEASGEVTKCGNLAVNKRSLKQNVGT
jgi:hypothetical protein